MSKKNGYSLSLKENGLVAMSVSSLAQGRWRVEGLDQSQDDDRPSSLAPEMNKNSERVTMMISGELVRTSLMALPKLKKKEMNLAVAGWVGREESSPVEDWSVSWRERLGREEEKPDQKDIFLIYASKNDVDNHMSSARTWGASPSRMLPEYMILDAMFRRHYPKIDELEAWNVVFVGKDDHFLCVSTQAGLLLTRPLPADLSDGVDGAEYVERLATEVDRSIFFARQTEFNPDIQKVVVCGDSKLAADLVEQLKEETTIAAEYWDVADCFEMEDGKLDSRLLLPAMAAALATQKNPFNLLPKQPSVLLGPVVLRRLSLAASTAAVAAVPILVAGGLVTSDIQDRYLERARLQLEQTSNRAEQATEIYKAQKLLMAREELIISFTENDTDYASVLLHLANITPEQIVYQDLRLKETNAGQVVLYLSGLSSADSVSEAQESFLKFQQALNSSALLGVVGEPRKLVINSQKIQGDEIKRVEFSMEYRVKLQTQSSNAVASVIARAER